MSNKKKPKPSLASEPQGLQVHDETTGASVLPPSERISRLVAQQTRFEGPIPHPEIFRKYGEVVPDAPERILKQFELDSVHAREIADKAIELQKTDTRRAQWMAWSLVMAGFVASTVLAIFNQPWVAGVIASTTLIGILSAYLGRPSMPKLQKGVEPSGHR